MSRFHSKRNIIYGMVYWIGLQLMEHGFEQYIEPRMAIIVATSVGGEVILPHNTDYNISSSCS